MLSRGGQTNDKFNNLLHKPKRIHCLNGKDSETSNGDGPGKDTDNPTPTGASVSCLRVAALVPEPAYEGPYTNRVRQSSSLFDFSQKRQV
jgi:hypothetical protein